MLRGDGGREKLQPPYLILLDLKMPRVSGVEFLDELRADPALKHSVVFVLTTSQATDDIRNAYERNVAGYICKSTGSDATEQVVELVRHFVSLVRLPEPA